MTDLKRFEYVLALAECLNFSQAAAKLNISQSTLSQQIQKTEKEIGVALFDRTTSTLTKKNKQRKLQNNKGTLKCSILKKNCPRYAKRKKNFPHLRR